MDEYEIFSIRCNILNFSGEKYFKIFSDRGIIWKSKKNKNIKYKKIDFLLLY